MLHLVLHYVVYGLFEFYLVAAFWFYRITLIDHLFEKLVLSHFKKAKINVLLNYKKKHSSTKENGNNGRNGSSKWPTIVVNDRRLFAAMAAYPTLALGEAFIVCN